MVFLNKQLSIMYAKNRLSFIALYLFLMVSPWILAQRATENTAIKTPTKLVVGVVVDQMRYDYLTRFWDQYSEGGFKRLVHGGFIGKNHHFNYAPTSTGPGHASVYTGTTPATHGIIGNDFFDIASGRMVYCAGDDQYSSVGVSSDEGNMSPHRLLTSTMTDQLRLHYKNKAKVISISVKDRGAVLPGGHMANAAYWFVGGEQGLWVTSTYYMDDLPKWVADYNTKQSIAQYKKPWDLLYNEKKYDLSVADDNGYEGPFKGEQKPVFPHDLPALWNQNGGYGILRATPYGNSMLTDFALEALKQEDLGQDKVPDFLAISYSSTDYVGHQFGVDSKEIQDTYLRLDLEIARLLKALDRQVGTGQYTLFLTSDHAAIPVPAYLQDQKIPAGYVEANAVKQGIDQFVQNRFGAGLVSNISNNQVFLDRKAIQGLGLDLDEVQAALADYLQERTDIAHAYTARTLKSTQFISGIPSILQMGYHKDRSGDVLFVYKPGFISYSKTGSTHGSPEIYDTHAPLLLYGAGVQPGATAERTQITDIAPTISVLLGIAFPNGTTGQPISKALKL